MSGEQPADLVEAMARAMCNRAGDFDLWASDLTPESRQGFLDDAAAALAVLPREVIEWLTARPEGLLLAPVELTPEQVEDLKARFEAAWQQPYQLQRLLRVSEIAEPVRYLLMDAYGLGMDDAEAGVKARVDADLRRQLAAEDQRSAEYLATLGIPVQDGDGNG